MNGWGGQWQRKEGEPRDVERATFNTSRLEKAARRFQSLGQQETLEVCDTLVGDVGVQLAQFRATRDHDRLREALVLAESLYAGLVTVTAALPPPRIDAGPPRPPGWRSGRF